MALSVANLAIPLSTPKTAPVTLEVSLSAPYVRRLHVQVEAAGLGKVGFRLAHNNFIFAPFIGVGLDQWITPLFGQLDWDEFLPLSGPAYKIQIEAYNTDTSIRALSIMFELSHENGLPVKQVQVPVDTRQPQAAPETESF